ncbi:MAG: hypothetical protein Ct9H300mP20_09140 [Gammaproteobacteria bacterium]|nr:MAG: hypothetical protein Ct9H300mP20_09140 [Gammaproteobacteria bacterium]
MPVDNKRAGLVIARSPKARELKMHPKVLEVTEKALSHSTNFQLHNAQVLAVGPGSELQPIHPDQWAFDFFPFHQVLTQHSTCGP